MACRKNAFTLVELLVVMAIISLLAGMLLPVLSKALHTARAVSCQNNMKQLYLSVLLYADDNSSIINPPYDGNAEFTSYGCHWAHRLQVFGYLGGTMKYQQACRCPAPRSQLIGYNGHLFGSDNPGSLAVTGVDGHGNPHTTYYYRFNTIRKPSALY